MRHILVVDDEADIVGLFTQRFRKEIRAGLLQFTFAHSGEEALAVYTERAADFVLILSDVHMPGMDGLQLLQALRSRDPLVPVWIITAFGHAEKELEARQLGATGFAPKPIDFDQLRPAILGTGVAP